jgi:hypothetical protein
MALARPQSLREPAEYDDARTSGPEPVSPQHQATPASLFAGSAREPSRERMKHLTGRPDLRVPALRQAQQSFGNRLVQRMLGDGERSSDHAGSLHVPDGPSAPLPEPERHWMEARYGHDFSAVRVHTDAAAAEAAGKVNAQAFTSVRDIYFAEGMYAPSSSAGRHLLAHELAHTIQQEDLSGSPGRAVVGQADDPMEHQAHAAADHVAASRPVRSSLTPDSAPTIRRQEVGNPPAPVGSSAQNVQGLRVEVLTPEQYKAMTGQSVDALPEGQYVPGTDLRWQPGVGAAVATPALPGLPIPEGSTGILWQGSHLSDIAVTGGDLTAMGFRAELWRHIGSQLERNALGQLIYGRGGGPLTTSLNRGVPGSYANDWLFPYMPGATAVYRNNPNAPDFLAEMMKQAPGFEGEPYTFSTPPITNPAYARSFGTINPCPPGVGNCINLPASLHDEALGGRNLVLDNEGNPIDIVTGEGGSQPGMARNMDAYVDQPDAWFAERGLTRTPVAGPMWARAGAGVIKAGGVVLVVYGAVKSAERIADATPEERPIVVGEEAGGWIGGYIGNVLASALGGAVVCAETGPGAFFCAVGFGIAGAVTGSVVGQSLGHDLAKAAVDLSNMTPAQFNQSALLMFGTPEQRRAAEELRRLESGDTDPDDF